MCNKRQNILKMTPVLLVKAELARPIFVDFVKVADCDIGKNASTMQHEVRWPNSCGWMLMAPDVYSTPQKINELRLERTKNKVHAGVTIL